MERNFVSTRRRFVLVALFLAAFVVLLNTTTLVLYRRAQRHLDDELGARLRTAAAGVAGAVRLGWRDSIPLDIPPPLLQTLYTFRDENELSNVVIIRPSGRTLLDLAGYAETGEMNPLVDIDFAAVTLARSGVASPTRLYRSGSLYMKSAYAPVLDSDGTVPALVGVEAGAEFFGALEGLRSLIFVISVASLAAVTIIGVVFFRMSRSLDRALAAAFLNENMAAMGRMAANIAHEIRNPLGIIRASAARIRRRKQIDEEALDYIVEEVDALNEVLTGYLEFARDPVARQYENVDVGKVVRRAIAAANEESHSRGVAVSAHDIEHVAIHGSEQRIRQAVINVVLNAVQACGTGENVHVDTRQSPDGVDIIVTDSGCGIPEADLPGVTRPFFTRRASGSGLGLHIVETVVREHNGTLHIESEPGRGTTVRMRFPRVPTQPEGVGCNGQNPRSG